MVSAPIGLQGELAATSRARYFRQVLTRPVSWAQMRDLDAVACVELAHRGSEMRLDGADADMQLIGDLAVGPTTGDRQQDLLLSDGEGFHGLRWWGARMGVSEGRE